MLLGTSLLLAALAACVTAEETVYCDYPGTIAHGRILLVGVMGKYEYRPYVQHIGHNAQIEFHCLKEYKLVGPEGSTCVDGEWSPPVHLATCELLYIFRGRRDTSGLLQRADEEADEMHPGVALLGDTSSMSDEVIEDIYNKESCGTSPYRDAGAGMSRIINGKAARPGEFPWQVSLQHNKGHFCGGTVLSDRFILTAAHCVAGGYREMCSLSVLAGAHNKSADEVTQQRVNFKNITLYPDWDQMTTRGDIAVIELDSRLTLSETTVAACLPDRTHGCYIGEEAIISGWGAAYQDEEGEFTHPDLLQYARIRIKPLKFCADFAKNTTMTHFVQPDMFCLSGTGYGKKNRSACHGDSGGPLAVKDGDRWVILGATTFGFTFSGLEGCIQGAPFFYRSVPYYISWIKEQMQM